MQKFFYVKYFLSASYKKIVYAEIIPTPAFGIHICYAKQITAKII